jgi:hypothetical protein
MLARDAEKLIKRMNVPLVTARFESSLTRHVFNIDRGY